MDNKKTIIEFKDTEGSFTSNGYEAVKLIKLAKEQLERVKSSVRKITDELIYTRENGENSSDVPTYPNPLREKPIDLAIPETKTDELNYSDFMQQEKTDSTNEPRQEKTFDSFSRYNRSDGSEIGDSKENNGALYSENRLGKTPSIILQSQPKSAEDVSKNNDTLYSENRLGKTPSIILQSQPKSAEDVSKNIESMLDSTDEREHPSVYKVLVAANDSIKKVLRRIHEAQESIKKLEADSQKNAAAKSYELRNLKALEDAFSKIENISFAQIHFVGTRNEVFEANSYISEANNILENMYDNKNRFGDLIIECQKNVDTYSNADAANKEQIEEVKSMIRELGKKLGEVYTQTEVFLADAVKLDKKYADEVRVQKEAQELSSNLESSLNKFGNIIGEESSGVLQDDDESSEPFARKQFDKLGEGNNSYGNIINLAGSLAGNLAVDLTGGKVK